MLKMVAHAYKQTGMKNLCIAGGVALNSVANGRIMREGPFESVYIQPAAGDAGGALGAALYAYHVLLGKPRKFFMESAYWGKAYSHDDHKAAIEDYGYSYEYVDDVDKVATHMVDDILAKRVIGLYQGRFEWGPRALGNRSIMADPRGAEMKGIVNERIKFREPFRPFAPVVLRERAAEYFDYPDVAAHEAPRYMLIVAPIKEDKQHEIEAVNHAGTGRLQTIERETNLRYYDIVKQFGEATGTPIVLNTSFNLRGEPIVNTPAEAFNTFRNSDIDMLAIGPYLVRK